jgi:ribosomal protein S18 acetylase RimI-like enzyme
MNFVIRPITLKDCDARHRFWVELSFEQSGMVHTADETDLHTHETYDKIQDFLRSRRGLWLIALHNNQVVGEIDISVKPFVRIKHCGLLTIGVIKAYQDRGLGSKLMEEALLWAKKEGLKRIELYVFDSNKKAQNLYKKYNFIVEGRRKFFLYHGDNNYEDDLLMALYL